MRRIHLFELEDLEWFPDVLRNGMTLYLETVQRVVGLPKLFAPLLRRALEQTQARRLVDLGSGGGGPIRQAIAAVESELHEPIDVTLTDFRPNERAIHAIQALRSERFRYLTEPVDACDVPVELEGVRTMFASFHHLKVDAARRVLEAAYVKGEPICIFEITDPTPVGVAACAMMPLYVFAFTPLVRPLSASQLFFTYVVPILPFAIAWDGLVSTLRTYSIAELRDLTRDLSDETYEWEIGTVPDPRLPLRFPYVLGLPRRAAGTYRVSDSTWCGPIAEPAARAAGT